jgi:hypothetical protein
VPFNSLANVVGVGAKGIGLEQNVATIGECVSWIIEAMMH